MSYDAMAMQAVTWVRWLHIQWHRAEIERLLKSKSRNGSAEIAQRMNAIALLCDRGRTQQGRMLAENLARDGGIGLNLSDFNEPF